jgi:gamma-glutamylcyclotransferase (GGCT)/AIG2-like uncharacterized protein YtfP
MKKGDCIAVYGTLRKGERADLARQANKFDVTYLCKDRINGKLYHLGAYPGVKTESKSFDPKLPCVTVEVFHIRDESIIAILDAYEGYNSDNPEHGLYNRIEVESEDGRIVWVYIYNGPVTPDQLIESGDWVKNREIPVRNRQLG